MIASYDIDGVIFLPEPYTDCALIPPPSAVIISGRSVDEWAETQSFLKYRGITNRVFLNPVKFEEKTRRGSAEHKINTILALCEAGLDIGIHYEDDPEQANIIRWKVPGIKVVHVNHQNLMSYENKRQWEHGIER